MANFLAVPLASSFLCFSDITEKNLFKAKAMSLLAPSQFETKLSDSDSNFSNCFCVLDHFLGGHVGCRKGNNSNFFSTFNFVVVPNWNDCKHEELTQGNSI